MSIPFTQYVRPYGRKRRMTIDLPPDVEERAQKVIAAGWLFEAEILTTDQVSFSVHNPHSDEPEDVAIRICDNGPEVPAVVTQLIDDAIAALAQWETP